MSTDNEYLRLIYAKLAGFSALAPGQSILSNLGNSAILTVPNQGVQLALGGRSRVSIGMKISSINASVGIALQASLKAGGLLYPLSADGATVITLTANGTYLYTWEGAAEEVHVKFDSETGGTDALIDVLIRAQ